MPPDLALWEGAGSGSAQKPSRRIDRLTQGESRPLPESSRFSVAVDSHLRKQRDLGSRVIRRTGWSDPNPSKRLMITRRTLTACGAGTVILSLATAQAADVSWVGDTSTDWNTGTNWSTDLLPTAVDNVLVNTSTGNIATLSANSAFTPVDIKVGTTGAGRLDHTAGTVATGNNNWAIAGQGTNTGTYNLANTGATGGATTGFGLGSGSLDIGGTSTNGGRLVLGDGGASNGIFNMNTTGTLESWHTNPSMVIGTNGGDGTFNLDAGTVNTRDVWIGDNNVNSAGTINISGGTFNTEDFLLGRANAQGVVAMTGGTVNATWVAVARSTAAANTGTGTFTIGANATVNSTGYVEVGLGGNGATGAAQGTMTVSGALNVNTGNLGGKLGIATYDSVKGTLNIESGALVKLHNNAQFAFANVNNTGTGVVNHNGGTVTFYSNGGTTEGGTGFLNMQQGGSGAYTYHLNGGTLSVPRIGSVAATGSRTFNFNGGTLKATGSSATFLDLGTGTARINVRNGGAIIDTNGFDVTVTGALLHSDVSGDAATDGGLTKNGAGTLALKGANTFTGSVTVNAGKLSYGDAQIQPLTVAGGATLAVTPSTGTIGTLTVPSLALQAGSTVEIELSSGGGSNDQIEATTAGTGLNLGTASVRLLEDGTTNAFQTLGTYTLFKYTGGFTGSASNLTVANPVLGFTYTFAATGSEITVTIASSDSDNDGLPNAWEIANGLDPNDPNGVNGPDGNLDGDFATNLEEFQAGTAANNADSDPLDIDNDGLLDSWEVTHFTNITARDGTGDYDGDLATDLAEFVADTLPKAADPSADGDWPDADGDSMNDAWEVKYFGSIAAKDGSADSDADGANDLTEFQALSSPTDAAWTPTTSKLIHRWSFNNSLADSIASSAAGPDAHANSPATIEDPNGVDASSAVTLSSTDVLLAGGARGTSDYVKLGSNLLGGRAVPATIEVFASQVSIQNWSRVFDFGSAETENLFMNWTNGTAAGTTRVEFRDYVISSGDTTNQPYALNTEYHIVFTFEPGKGDFGTNRVTYHVAPSEAGNLGAARGTFSTANNLTNFADTAATLGRSSYAGDNTANGRYNDVRIWLGNLAEAQREKLHDLGADSVDLTDTDGDGLLDAWETTWFGSAAAGVASADPDGDGFDNLAEQDGRSIPVGAGATASTPLDRDADLLDDTWEITNFAGLGQTGSGDPDGDLATNEEEEGAGSNPNNAASWPDTDGDLIKDAWEILHFGDLDIDDDANNANDGAADFDGDGSTDKQEFDAGSNPTLASSVAPAVVVLPATGTDAASDIASTKTYTHAIDFGATVTAVAVNGVDFHQASVPATGNDGSNNDRWDSIDNTGGRSGPFRMDKSMANDWPQNNNNPANVGSDGNMANILTDFSHINGTVVGSTQTITLGGLTAGTRYSTRLYYRTWALAGARSTTLTFDGDGTNVNLTFNPDQSATPESGYVKYDFTANDSDLTIVFAANSAGNSWHQYALTNEVVPAGDADNDSLPDAWEITYFGDTTSQGAAGDPDNDGTDNRAEYLLGFSPVDGSQRFRATESNVVPGAGVTLTWPAQNGLTFTVWRSTNLASWTQLGGTVTASGSTASYTDSTAPLGKAFYRVTLTTP